VTSKDEIRKKFKALSPVLNERVTRLWAAAAHGMAASRPWRARPD
jgi:hypothetical protein